MEVIYTGLHQTPEMVVEAAIQEDVDVLGLSSLSGAHATLFPRVIAGLRAVGLDDILIVAGGVIPPDDAAALKAGGRGGGLRARHLARDEHRLHQGTRAAQSPPHGTRRRIVTATPRR